jgi:hypothetical protein
MRLVDDLARGEDPGVGGLQVPRQAGLDDHAIAGLQVAGVRGAVAIDVGDREARRVEVEGHNAADEPVAARAAVAAAHGDGAVGAIDALEHEGAELRLLFDLGLLAAVTVPVVAGAVLRRRDGRDGERRDAHEGGEAAGAVLHQVRFSV